MPRSFDVTEEDRFRALEATLHLGSAMFGMGKNMPAQTIATFLEIGGKQAGKAADKAGNKSLTTGLATSPKVKGLDAVDKLSEEQNRKLGHQ